jgi:phosphoglycerol transferase MdoB-like AlkP superfamily enzyme
MPRLAVQNAPKKVSSSFQPLRSQLSFIAFSAVALLSMYSLLRAALLFYNRDLIGDTPLVVFAEAFFNGLRFDLRVVVYACVPLLMALLNVRVMQSRGWQCAWLTFFASLTLFLGLAELDFYKEFHQRLNSLVFQYLQEDQGTVLSMLWNGFPVARYLVAWLLITGLLWLSFSALDRLSHSREVPAEAVRPNVPWYWRGGVFVICLGVAVVAARGHWRQGPPLRWGDAYTTESMFANQLGLNGTLSLFTAAQASFGQHRDNSWKATMDAAQARQITRDMLMTPDDTLVDAHEAAIRRVYTPPSGNTLPIRNVVVILLESFAGHSVGALGAPGNITPYFDRLSQQGLLFDRFFSNGTHTHQGMFATMACFPNLPGFEYLMRTPEGAHQFSGLPQLLGQRGFDNLYVYNGNFQWDNQSGFFSNQGMSHFIGREDFVDPVFMDPTWGVSDQDMFDRAALELQTNYGKKPFYALLQSLSNHTPYALPANLPVERVLVDGKEDLHRTAMRYSDWALGRFFEKASKAPYFKETLFVVVGDHGFGAHDQVTEMDLQRFNVPLLLIAPGIQEKFGSRCHTVGTQVDIVPTIMGRLGGEVRHQCWGRDLLNLPQADAGMGVIKPSGGEQTVAIVTADTVLVQPKGFEPRFYRYQLGAKPTAQRIPGPVDESLKKRLEAYLQTATESLLENTAGVVGGVPDKP